jgi:DNA-binding response OmpR family regulator
MRILVVEDDRKVANFIQSGLAEEGYAVDVLYDGNHAGEQANAFDYDAVVLDLMLPGRSGFQVLRDIRARKHTLPILILTAKDTVQERVAGLDGGADDYMVKPFALAQLPARLRAVMRRSGAKFCASPISDGHRAPRRPPGRQDDRSQAEGIRAARIPHQEQRSPVTKSLIIEHVWNIHFDSVSNVVEVHINSLRNKLDRGFPKPLILTSPRVG